MATAPSITLTDLGLDWPDGSVALRGITATFGTGRTGLVGNNGSGKSTLLRLLAGELTPTRGGISAVGDVASLRQSLTLEVEATAADLLGVRATLDALRAIEAGDVAEHHFDAVGTDWDIATRTGEALRTAGLGEADLERRVGTLSGGEAILVAIAGLRLRGAPITLLDEPTNNLDADARARLATMVRSWRGALIVVSHDTALLDLMDDTAELRDGTLTTFGGGYSAWREHLALQQEAALQGLRTAEQVVKREKLQRVEAESRLARRASAGRKAFAEKRVPKIVANGRKSSAQASAGKLRGNLDDRLQDARVGLDQAVARVRADTHIHVDLPDAGVPVSRRLAVLRGTNREFVLQGPERVALVGPNGVGKTTLLEGMLHPATARSGLAAGELHTDRVGYLTQRLDGLDDAVSVLENVRAAAPTVPPGEVRNRLARFLIRGDAVDRPVGSLSGGERFRVSLACLLLAEPPRQLLVLDEPTNNLDLTSVDQLVGALASYTGGLLVVSHDDAFLARIGIDRMLRLDVEGGLTEVG